MYLLHLFQGREEKGQCDLLCGAPLDDLPISPIGLIMLVYVDVLFTCVEYGFNFLESWSYSKNGCRI